MYFSIIYNYLQSINLNYKTVLSLQIRFNNKITLVLTKNSGRKQYYELKIDS